MADIICMFCGKGFEPPEKPYSHLKCSHCKKVVDVEYCKRLQAKKIHWQVKLYGGDIRDFDHLPSVHEIRTAFQLENVERHIQSLSSYVEDE